MKFCRIIPKYLQLQINQNNLPICSKRYRFLHYESDISLSKLYPNSKPAVTASAQLETKNGKFNGYIPLEELQITYSRSSGPGGQNVNCVNTKVDLRFKVETANWISDKVKTQLLTKHKTKINKDGFYIIKSDATRSQQMNLAHVLEKIRILIREMEIEVPQPSEETIEKIRRNYENASRERLKEKRIRSQIKEDRQSPII